MAYVQWNDFTTYVLNDVVEYTALLFEATVTNTNVLPLPMNATWILIGAAAGGLVQTLSLAGDTISLDPYGSSVNVASATSVASVVTKTQNITTIGITTDISGTVTAPTQLPADDSTKIATTAYVKSVVSSGGGGNMLFSGPSAIGNHCVSSGVTGETYMTSSLNESLLTFNFGGKDVTNTNSITSTSSLGLNATTDININATQVNSCPIQVGVPGSANTYVGNTYLRVRNGTTPTIYTDITPTQVQLINGSDNSKLTYDKLYSNSNNATTISIIDIANDYASGTLNVDNITSGSLLTLTAPQIAIDTSNINLLQGTILQTNDNLAVVSHAGTLNLSTENGTLNIFTNGLSPQDVAINSTQDVLISSTRNIITDSTNNTTMNTTGTFGITAGNNIGITANGTSHNITATATGAINLTATGNVNVNASQAEFSATPIHTSSSTTANSFIKIGGTSAEVLLADGTTAPYNSGGSGGNYFLYQSSTDTTVPPSISQHVQYNNSVQPSATIVWINHITDDNIDIDFYLAQIGLGDILYFQDRNDSTNWIKYAVTSVTIIPNDYVTYGVTYVNSEGTGSTNFPNNHPIFFTSYVDSATINTRLNALEQKTVYQSTPTLNQTNFAGTVYADTLKIATGTASQYLMADGTTSALTTIGTSGVGTSLVKTGTSPSFVLNSLAVSTGLSSNLAGDTITLTNSSPASDISLASSGSGTTLLNSTTNPSFSTKSLAVGTGLSIASTTDTITLTNTVTGSTLANAGAGTSLVVSGTAPSLSVKSLSSGTGITLNDASNNIEIVNSSPASGISLSNAGTGTSLLSSTSNPTFSTKSLTAGTNITFTSTANDITINSTGGGGGTYTFTNGGTGTTLVSTSSTSTAFQPVSITAGANCSITSSGTDIVIASSGASGTNTISVVLEALSASTFYPTFVNGAGTKTVLNYDSGMSYIPSTNALTTSAYFASGKYTSSLALTSIAFEGLARTSQKVTTTDGSAFTSTYYPTFVPSSSSQNEQSVNTDSALTYIPSTNTLTVQNHNGTLFTATTSSPTIGFVGHATSASQVQTIDGSAFTSAYFVSFVPVSASSPSQAVYTDSALSYIPSTNTLGLSATTNFTGILYTSSNIALVAGFVGTASRALELSQTNVDSATATYYPLLSTSSASSTTLNPSEAMAVDSGLSYVPSTNTLTATTFVGALTGTASKATNIVGTGTNQLVIQTALDTTSTSALANGASGTFLKSNGATSLPSWVASSTLGFQMSFGGKIILANEYLSPNKFADPSSSGITTASYLTDWKCPVACSITAWSTAVQTTAVASLTIIIAGFAGTAITGAGTSSTNTGTITARAVAAGDVIQVRMTGITGGTCVTLYFT